jgi:hypothetical protein
MVSHVTAAIIQAFFGLTAIIASGALQAYALSEMQKSSLKTSDLDNIKQLLTGTVIAQFIAALILLVALIMILARGKDGDVSGFAYTALIAAGLLLFASGVVSANIAMRLQCYRNDPNIQVAWQMSTYSAIVGIVGSILLLVVQTFVRKDTLRDKALYHLATEMKRVPRSGYEATVQRTLR